MGRTVVVWAGTGGAGGAGVLTRLAHTIPIPVARGHLFGLCGFGWGLVVARFWFRAGGNRPGEQNLTLLGRGRGALPDVVGARGGGLGWW